MATKRTRTRGTTEGGSVAESPVDVPASLTLVVPVPGEQPRPPRSLGPGIEAAPAPDVSPRVVERLGREVAAANGRLLAAMSEAQPTQPPAVADVADARASILASLVELEERAQLDPNDERVAALFADVAESLRRFRDLPHDEAVINGLVEAVADVYRRVRDGELAAGPEQVEALRIALARRFARAEPAVLARLVRTEAQIRGEQSKAGPIETAKSAVGAVLPRVFILGRPVSDAALTLSPMSERRGVAPARTWGERVLHASRDRRLEIALTAAGFGPGTWLHSVVRIALDAEGRWFIARWQRAKRPRAPDGNGPTGTPE